MIIRYTIEKVENGWGIYLESDSTKSVHLYGMYQTLAEAAEELKELV